MGPDKQHAGATCDTVPPAVLGALPAKIYASQLPMRLQPHIRMSQLRRIGLSDALRVRSPGSAASC